MTKVLDRRALAEEELASYTEAVEHWPPGERDEQYVELKNQRDDLASQLGQWHVTRSDGELGRVGGKVVGS